jgi:hypothetical protein
MDVPWNSMAFGLSTAQILTAVLVPFSQKLLIRINSWIAGCIWRIMQAGFLD